MNIYQPIILIGAGRSGTTLLTRLFDRHPDIDFRGETAFLLPRLWLEIWEDRFWFNWQHYTDKNPRSSSAPFPTINDDVLDQTRKRIGGIIAHAIVEILSIDTHTHTAWGYKEIWNGSSQFQYDWLPYHMAFPEAIWVHLIRNPFEFTESCASWNNERLTLSYLRDRLIDWVAIIKYSRRLIPTKRYFEVRYEDLIAKPQETIQPILERADLTWHAECEKALESFVLRSNKKSCNPVDSMQSAHDVKHILETTEDAIALMRELDYTIPEMIPIDTSDPVHESLPVTELHMQEPMLHQVHKPQYLLNQSLQQYALLQRTCQQMQKQYQDILVSETYRLAQKIQQSWIMKVSRLLRKQH
jgi:hypothetical protein